MKAATAGGTGVRERAVEVQSAAAKLQGDLGMPEGATGCVLFAHGSGSGRFSPRNRQVARILREAGVGTLLLDLLTPREEAIDERTAQFRFDIELLAKRLAGATDWVASQPESAGLPLGYFGVSTGAAAALIAAANRPNMIDAVVSRSGRPDLADAALPRVRAATLLIVGGEDTPVIALNKAAFQQLGVPDKQLVIVPEATHLFEEPGALEEVASLAADWFTRWLGVGHSAIH